MDVVSGGLAGEDSLLRGVSQISQSGRTQSRSGSPFTINAEAKVLVGSLHLGSWAYYCYYHDEIMAPRLGLTQVGLLLLFALIHFHVHLSNHLAFGKYHSEMYFLF